MDVCGSPDLVVKASGSPVAFLTNTFDQTSK